MFYRSKELPAFVRANGLLEASALPKDAIKWSGEGDPPAIGDDIDVALNSVGVSKVVEYGVEDGWLGVMAYPLAPPAWWVKANGEPSPSNAAIVFGCEIRYPRKEG